MTRSVGDTNPSHAAGSAPIRASELAQYSFCHRAWWLERVKKLPADSQARLARGRQAHLRHEDRVSAAARWRRVGLILIGAGGLSLVAALLWLFAAGGG
jgi:hypothetical protein